MMRRYLACCPEEEPRIFRMSDLISWGAQGHGPIHLLLISASELGFSSSLRMMTGPIQHFHASILDAWLLVSLPKYPRGRFFWELSMLIIKVLYNYLPLPICGKEIKMLLRAIVWGRLERIPSWQGQEGRGSLSFLW